MGTLTLEHKAGIEKLHTWDQEALKLIFQDSNTEIPNKNSPFLSMHLV
jgi:hypothetical protein